MTAMPPTTGHFQLIQFASLLAPAVYVILCTQPHEPYSAERAEALRSAIAHHELNNVELIHYNKVIEQDPSSPGFHEMWKGLMKKFGISKNDLIVASEPYGKWLADITGAHFFPYDIHREVNPAKATAIREDPLKYFTKILPEFQANVVRTITVFGAESTGKTTLSKQLAEELGGTWLFEYARPYLENTKNEITRKSMKAIWRGQAALQRHGQDFFNKPFIIQDTDLFSTVGYWQFPHWQKTLGECPKALIAEAKKMKSDLYIITRSNIPFEKDPLRYGGSKREGSDEYWINVCKAYNLPYVILGSNDRAERLNEAVYLAKKAFNNKARQLAFDRGGL